MKPANGRINLPFNLGASWWDEKDGFNTNECKLIGLDIRDDGYNRDFCFHDRAKFLAAIELIEELYKRVDALADPAPPIREPEPEVEKPKKLKKRRAKKEERCVVCAEKEPSGIYCLTPRGLYC